MCSAHVHVCNSREFAHASNISEYFIRRSRRVPYPDIRTRNVPMQRRACVTSKHAAAAVIKASALRGVRSISSRAGGGYQEYRSLGMAYVVSHAHGKSMRMFARPTFRRAQNVKCGASQPRRKVHEIRLASIMRNALPRERRSGTSRSVYNVRSICTRIHYS